MLNVKMLLWLFYVQIIMVLGSEPNNGTTTVPLELNTTGISTTTSRLMPTPQTKVNASSSVPKPVIVPEIITLDTRTPPKFKQHTKKKTKPIQSVVEKLNGPPVVPEVLENSHAGIAIPILDPENFHFVDNTEPNHYPNRNRVNFYKIEKQRPTTNSGISTWILLNQQQQMTSTTVPPPPPPTTVMTTTRKPVSTTTTTKPVLFVKKRPTTVSTATTKNSTGSIKRNSTNSNVSTTTTTTTTVLPIESKKGDLELTVSNKLSSRRPVTGNSGSTQKKKKNKNRRRRPSTSTVSGDKSVASTGTKPVKSNNVAKPISTQLYNYLSREVIPTVGVGLVGLMVTAGLASYFLYPFTAARRSYEIDRRGDKDGYYYHNTYASNNDYFGGGGGIAEEELIGKVLAGMPAATTNKMPTSRFQHHFKYGNSRFGGGSTASSTNTNTPTTTNTVMSSTELYPVYNNNKGTPMAVPEHGPRALKFKRDVKWMDPSGNELNATVPKEPPPVTEVVPSGTNDGLNSFFRLIRDLIRLKVHLGLQIVQNATLSISKYLSNVQTRLEDHYRHHNDTKIN